MDPIVSSPDMETEPERKPPRIADIPRPKQIASGEKLESCKCKSAGQNLVVCIDGILNQFGAKDTNVIELYRRLTKDDKQLTSYNNGVGTYARPSWRSYGYWKQVSGSKIDVVIAWNFEKLVIGAYRWLSENYLLGDRIFLFGFSRGAYQVRVLSAMIATVGLIHKGNEDQISLAYKLYADRRTKPTALNDFKIAFSRPDVGVHFVGAWDTVSSVGIIRNKNLPKTTDGMQHVCFFRHALALDERRVGFLPEYAWGGEAREEHGVAADLTPHTKGVWFSGTHSDIGGGNVNNPNMDQGRLSLRWMSREAQSVGLHFEGRDANLEWETLGSINKSLTLPWLPFELLPIRRLSYRSRNGTTFSYPRARLPGNSKWINEAKSQDTFNFDHIVELVKVYSDIARAIVRDFKGLTADPRPVARHLGKVMARAEGFNALRETPDVVEALSLAFHNLGYGDTGSARDVVLDALRKMDEIDEGTQMPRVKTSSGIISIAASPNGHLVASGSLDHIVRIYSAETGHVIGEPLKGHVGPVSSVAFSHDGKRLGSGSWDKTIRVWDMEDLAEVKLQKVLSGHTAAITSIAFSSTMDRLVSGSWDKTARVWDMVDTRTTDSRVFKGHNDSISTVAISSDGLCIVSGSRDRTVRVWNAGNGDLILKIAGKHTGPITSVVFSPSGDQVASGSGDGTIRVWDSDIGDTRICCVGHTSSITSIAFSLDGERIISGSLDQTIRVWEVDSGKAIGAPLTGHTGSVTSVVLSSDGRQIMSGSLDGSIKSWFAFPLQGHTQRFLAIAYSSDGRRVVSSSYDHTIRVWNTETLEAIGKPFSGHTDWVRSVAYTPDGKRVVSGSMDRTVRVWNTETGNAIGEPFRGHKGSVESIAYSPDGTRVVSGSEDHTIRVWHAETGEAIGEPFRGHEGPVWSVAYSPDGERIVSGSSDATIRMWNAETGKAIGGPFRGHTSRVRSVAYTPDGRLIVSGSGDCTIRVWDAETGGAIGKPWEARHGDIYSVAISRDGKHIVSRSVSWDTVFVDIWDLEEGEHEQSSSIVSRPHAFSPVWSIDTRSYT